MYGEWEKGREKGEEGERERQIKKERERKGGE